ncbi:MAG: zinc metallopeptidase [Acidobacteriota bacterium]
MFFFDPMYLLFVSPALLLGFYAQMKVKSAFKRFSRVSTLRGVTGAQVARSLLDAQGLSHVKVERSKGMLSDHYDPRGKVLRLSPGVYDSHSIAAAGVAAHEMGHALQDAESYAPLTLRTAMVPAVQFGSWLFIPIFFLGFLLNFPELAWVGVILFAGTVVFSLVTLPVEFDASHRAKRLLVNQGVLLGQEMAGVNKVLNAAALTYVAAAIQAVLTLLYYLFLLGGRRD